MADDLLIGGELGQEYSLDFSGGIVFLGDNSDGSGLPYSSGLYYAEDNNLTWEIEIELYPESSGTQAIYSESGNDQFSYIRIEIDSQKVRILAKNEGSNEFSLSSSSDIPLNEYTTLKVTRSSDGTWKIFFDETEEASGSWSIGSWNYAPASGYYCYSLGKTYYGWNEFDALDGRIKNTNIKSDGDEVASYELNEGSGTEISDSLNNYGGTLDGSVSWYEEGSILVPSNRKIIIGGNAQNKVTI